MDNSACLHLIFSSGPQWQLAGNRTWSKLPVLQGSNQPDRESYTPQQLRGPTRFTMRRSSCTKWTSDVSVIVGLDRVNQHHTQTQLCTIILQVLTQIPTTPQDSLIDKQLDPIHVFELWTNGPCKGLSGAWQSFPMWTSFSSNSLDINKEIINSNPSFYSWQGARMVWECTWRYEEWACKIITICWMIKNDIEYLTYLDFINFLKVSQLTIA